MAMRCSRISYGHRVLHLDTVVSLPVDRVQSLRDAGDPMRPFGLLICTEKPACRDERCQPLHPTRDSDGVNVAGFTGDSADRRIDQFAIRLCKLSLRREPPLPV
jgi:hypothetical protein